MTSDLTRLANIGVKGAMLETLKLTTGTLDKLHLGKFKVAVKLKGQQPKLLEQVKKNASDLVGSLIINEAGFWTGSEGFASKLKKSDAIAGVVGFCVKNCLKQKDRALTCLSTLVNLNRKDWLPLLNKAIDKVVDTRLQDRKLKILKPLSPLAKRIIKTAVKKFIIDSREYNKSNLILGKFHYAKRFIAETYHGFVDAFKNYFSDDSDRIKGSTGQNRVENKFGDRSPKQIEITDEKSAMECAGVLIAQQKKGSMTEEKVKGLIEQQEKAVENSNMGETEKANARKIIDMAKRENYCPSGDESDNRVEHIEDKDKGTVALKVFDAGSQAVEEPKRLELIQNIGKILEELPNDRVTFLKYYTVNKRFKEEVADLDITVEKPKYKYWDLPFMRDEVSTRMVHLYRECDADYETLNKVSNYLNTDCGKKLSRLVINSLCPREGSEDKNMVKFGGRFFQLKNPQQPRFSFKVHNAGKPDKPEIEISIEASWDVRGHSNGLDQTDKVHTVQSDKKSTFDVSTKIHIKPEIIDVREDDIIPGWEMTAHPTEKFFDFALRKPSYGLLVNDEIVAKMPETEQ